MFPMIDHAGPMASSIRDTALLLSVLAGYDGFDPRMTPETPLRAAIPQYHALLDEQIAARVAAGTWTAQKAARGLRIGVLKEGFEVADIDAGVTAAIRKAASRFAALGASVAEVSVPLHLAAPHIFMAATRTHMADTQLFGHSGHTLSFPFPRSVPPPPDQAWYETMTAENPLVLSVLFGGGVLSDRSRYPESVRNKAVRHVYGLRAAYDKALSEFDVLIMPTTPTVAPRHAPADMDIAAKAGILLANTPNTMPFNVTGHPGLSMPVGWAEVEGGKAKLPVGMQIVGKRWDEQMVFLAAAAWEVGGMGLDEE